MMATNSSEAGWSHIGDAQVVANSDQQIVLKCGEKEIQITPLADDLVRIHVVGASTRAPHPSWAVVDNDWKLPTHTFLQDDRAITIGLQDFSIRISKRPVRIAFVDPNGEVINEDDSSKGIGWDGDQVRVWKKMPENEHYYGFGEKTGMLDRRGLAMTDWNYDIPAYTSATDPIYQSIPFFMGMKGGKFYGIFFDNSFKTFFDMGKESEQYYSFGAEGGDIDYYFFCGPNPKKIIGRYTELTGRMNLPPKWALGYQQCRWSYYPETRVREIAGNFRSRKIPCDVIYLDIDYMDGFRCFTWNTQNFPDPKKMTSDLAADGFKLVTIIDPGIKNDSTYWVHNEGAKGDHFVKNPDGSFFIGPVWPGNCAFPDFANTSARQWWGTLYSGLVSVGIKGFWNDMNEPSVFDVPTKTFPLDVIHDVDGVTTRHAEIHNVYGMQMARGTYEGLRKLRPNERPFVLTRAGYAGTQRYSAAWTGDNVSSWEHLAMAMPMCMNFGLSGQPFVGPDIGGFIGTPSGELYARWLQYGALLPLCRSHSVRGSINKEPWAFGKEFEEINRKSIELRYQLLPFLYTEFYNASQTGVPIMRPLVMEFPDDKTTYKIDTQFMVGDVLLVSPVLEAGSTSRTMYLPKGTWFDFWTREKVEGGRWIEANAPLDRLPLYVRAGAVIPMQQVVQYTDQAPADPLTFEIFPSDAAEGHCYEDDGISFDYQKGISRIVEITARLDADKTVVEMSPAKGSFKPSRSSMMFAINGVNREPKSVTANRTLLSPMLASGATSGWTYDPVLHRLSVKMDETQDGVIVTVK